MPDPAADAVTEAAPTILEIAVQDVSGAVAAVRAGAQRLELCTALAATGGVTPGVGLLEAVVEAVPRTGVHVLVRPRPGGFVYAPDEVAVQVREVRAAVRAGASGVVVGALTADGRVDEGVLERLVAAADGVEVTFHRAFDVLAPSSPALSAALEVLARHGVTRVLTSGVRPERATASRGSVRRSRTWVVACRSWRAAVCASRTSPRSSRRASPRCTCRPRARWRATADRVVGRTRAGRRPTSVSSPPRTPHSTAR